MGLQLPKRTRSAGLGALVAVGLLTLGACSSADQDQIGRLAMPEGASDRAPYIQSLWEGAWLAAILTGVLVWGLIAYVVVKYRRRSDDEIPVQTRYNLPLEILYTVAPVVMVLVFFFFTVDTQNKVLADQGEDADHTVEVVGQQWSWAFNYVEEEAVDGQTVNFVGTPAEPPTLYLPVGESVKFVLNSPDVIHSFWVPAFLQKMDVIPGRRNTFTLTPTREGTFVGKCAELCGAYHSRMLFNVEVVDRAEYDDYLRSLEEAGNVGLVLGGSNATTQQGLEEEVQDDDTTDGEGE